MSSPLPGSPPLIHLPSLASTNDYLIELTRRESWPEWTVVWADDQPQGRGQKGQQWQVEPGKNLTFSVLWQPRFLEARKVFRLSKVVALALQEVVAQLLPEREVQVKWPNDILVNSRKVAGILFDNQLDGKSVRQSVVGIGLNINQVRFPEAWGNQASSLLLESSSDQPFVRTVVLDQVLESLYRWYGQLASGGGEVIDKAYLQHLHGYQEDGRFSDAEGEFEGVIYGVDESGRLAIAQNGKVNYFDIKAVRQL